MKLKEMKLKEMKLKLYVGSGENQQMYLQVGINMLPLS